MSNLPIIPPLPEPKPRDAKMSKLMARLFFCIGPAFVFGLAAAIALKSMALALIVAVAMFGFGMQVTRDDTKEGRSNG